MVQHELNVCCLNPFTPSCPNEAERLIEMKWPVLTMGSVVIQWVTYRLEEASEVVCFCREAIALD